MFRTSLLVSALLLSFSSAHAALTVGDSPSRNSTPFSTASLFHGSEVFSQLRSMEEDVILCVAHAVTRNPVYDKEKSDFSMLIRNSIPVCNMPIFGLMTYRDFYFGKGSGELFYEKNLYPRLRGAVIRHLFKK